jgi:hypothetical protein
MTGVSAGGGHPLTPDEIEVVEYISARYREGLDIELIADLVERRQPGSDDDKYEDTSSAEKRLAGQILTFRNTAPTVSNLLKSQIEVITKGTQIIKSEGTYWRYEPCIERIFEMDYKEITRANRYIEVFEESDYDVVAEQGRQKFGDQHSSLAETGGPDFISELLDTIEAAFPITERGFPHLLALKRILDGDDPSVETLQRKKLTSVIRELTDIEEHLNSVYFDLIVSTYPSKLRNATAHGDLLHDAANKEIRIPSKNTVYSYEDLESTRRQVFSIVVFLTGTLQALIAWRAVTFDETLGIDSMDEMLLFASNRTDSNEF